MALVSIKKAALLGSLYLAQTVPKGYLKFLPVLMAERGESMLVISSVALFSMGDWVKPVFGMLVDTKRMSSMQQRKRVIIGIQLMIIATFGLSLLVETPELIQLAALFSFCSFLTSMHDTAVDGLAVQLLDQSEQAVGGFGQYAGYKLGSLLTGGILPSIVGSNHRLLCIGVMVPMLIVLVFTLTYDVSTSSTTSINSCSSVEIPPSLTTSTTPTSQQPSVIPLLQQYLTTSTGLHTISMLLAYKFADHGLDFIWAPMLVHAQFKRQAIVQTQFILGTAAAILGAFYGSIICKNIGSASKSLAYCAVLRIIPNLMQLWFACGNVRTFQWNYVAVHAVLENMAGSAVTGAMFALLLERADPGQPATSYAVLNTVALLGMSLGELLLGRLSHYAGFRAACLAGVAVNVAFPILALTCPPHSSTTTSTSSTSSDTNIIHDKVD